MRWRRLCSSSSVRCGMRAHLLSCRSLRWRDSVSTGSRGRASRRSSMSTGTRAQPAASASCSQLRPPWETEGALDGSQSRGQPRLLVPRDEGWHGVHPSPRASRDARTPRRGARLPCRRPRAHCLPARRKPWRAPRGTTSAATSNGPPSTRATRTHGARRFSQGHRAAIERGGRTRRCPSLPEPARPSRRPRSTGFRRGGSGRCPAGPWPARPRP